MSSTNSTPENLTDFEMVLFTVWTVLDRSKFSQEYLQHIHTLCDITICVQIE